MPTEDFREATSELFETDKVEVLEWSFDFGWNGAEIAPWCQGLIDRYSGSNSLTGHGVYLSALSAGFSERQKIWLAQAEAEFKSRNYIHASEHFGFSEGGPIERSAPLAVPMNAESLRQGKEMIKRFADATQRPVGLENLAFAFGLEDVKRQGEFIDRLISSVDGFLLLDVHNIYCQVENFRISERELLNLYPLSKVRELHLSGGSWSHSVSGNRLAVRRDTHDDAVPQEVFNLAALAFKQCSNIEYVILERLGYTMREPLAQEEFRDDFETLEEILELCYA